MKILITGGMGHIGSKLVDKLVKDKKIKKILIIDNFSNNKENTILFLKNRKKIIFINQDLIEYRPKKKLKVDCVIHLASSTNAEKSFDNKKKVLDNNILATKNLLRIINENTKILFSSSTSVYGSQYKLINSKNNQENIYPQSPYAESKILCENIIKKFSKNYCILRFGTIFGLSNGMRFHTAINKFCYQAIMKKKISIWRKFYKKKRPYLDLDDCIRSIIFCINNDKTQNKTLDVVTVNLKVITIIKNLQKLIKINKQFVSTKILNQFSYEVESDELKRLKFSFKGNIMKNMKKIITKLKFSNEIY